jgi:hypothetical protein
LLKKWPNHPFGSKLIDAFFDSTYILPFIRELGVKRSMKQRWYDKDPTLSMAFSLLHNASQEHQEMAAHYMFKIMEGMEILNAEALRTQEGRIRFMFPGFRRSQFEIHARHLVETIKHLPPDYQQMMAIQLIDYIYLLDCGLSEFPLPGEDEEISMAQRPESG